MLVCLVVQSVLKPVSLLLHFVELGRLRIRLRRRQEVGLLLLL